MLPMYSTALTVTKGKPLARGENYAVDTDGEKRILEIFRKQAKSIRVLSLECVFVILSYFGEGAGRAADRHLERVLLSLASSLSASPWSLSALQKGGARPCSCRRSDTAPPSICSTAAGHLEVSLWLLLSTS